jgi:hypothetical protein
MIGGNADPMGFACEFIANNDTKLHIGRKHSIDSSFVKLMTIDDSGNVGIGQASPSRPLQIGFTTTNGEAIKLDGNASYGATISYSRGGSYNWNAGVGGASSSASNIPSSFWGVEDVSQSNAVRLAIAHTTGFVGIGTETPDSQLEVVGESGIHITAGTGGRTLIIKPSPSGAVHKFESDNTVAGYAFSNNAGELMRIDSSGRLLIGDNSVHYSGTDLQVGNTSDSQNGIQIQTSTTGYGYVLFGDGTGASAYRGQISYKHGDDYMNFITSGSERMRIDATGTKFSENFSSTDDILHINPANGHNRTMELAGDAINVFFTGGTTSTTLKLNEDGGDVDICNGDLYIDESANAVGIGTQSPGDKLHIAGNVRIDGGDVLRWNGQAFIDTIGANDMKFRPNGTERVIFEAGGDAHFDQDVIAFSTTPSDKRLKTNIQDINYGLDTIMKLTPKEYDWKKDNRHDIGFIAQEVEEVIPEIVKDKKHFDKEIKTLDYEKLTAVLIKAVQEQQKQINELKEKLNG